VLAILAAPFASRECADVSSITFTARMEARMRSSRLVIMVVLSALSAALPPVAHAGERVRGTVVRVDGDEIYVDLVGGLGVEARRPARLWRPITRKHPVTGRPVVDEVPLGDLAIHPSGTAHLGVAGGRSRLPRSGRRHRRGAGGEPETADAARARAPAADPPPAEAMPEVDAEARAIVDVFAAQSGPSLAVRIAAGPAISKTTPIRPTPTACAPSSPSSSVANVSSPSTR
jgi:hypothetical protein